MKRVIGNFYRTALSLSLLLLILLALPGVPQQTQGDFPVQVIEELKKGIVSIWGPTSCFATGFIIHPDGYILTAAHVIDQIIKQGSPLVRLSSSAKYPATVILRDDDNDLALLRVSVPEKLPVVRLGDSDMVRTQDKALIIGFPDAAAKGCDKVVADPKGVVTRLDVTTTQRVGGQDRELKELIEISESTAIPGNSGGPVFNIAGDVIGVVIRGGAGFTIAVRINKAWGLFSLEVRQFLEQHPLFAEDFTVDLGDPAFWVKKSWMLWPLPRGLKEVVETFTGPLNVEFFPMKAKLETIYELDRNEVYSIETTAASVIVGGSLINTELPIAELAAELAKFIQIVRGIHPPPANVKPFMSRKVFRKDFRVQVKARHQAGPAGFYGIMFRMQQEFLDNYYMFAIGSNGFYILVKIKDLFKEKIEGPIKLGDYALGYGFAPAIIQGIGRWNMLEIEAHGPEIKAFVNGQLLITVKDEDFREGFIALLAGSFDAPGTYVQFDDFTILPSIPSNLPPSRRNYNVCPSGCLFTRITAAVSAAHAGDVITIGPGVYDENVVIMKDITLRGAGQDQTTIRGVDPGWPVILVKGEQPIEVTFDSLAITNAKRLSPNEPCADLKQWICPNGIDISGQAKAVITNVRVSNNYSYGISIKDSARASIVDVVISRNFAGIYIQREGKASITNAAVKEGFIGVLLQESGKLEAYTNRIFDNLLYGVALFQRPCFDIDFRFTGEIKGNGNQIYNNQGGNLCPPPGQYPWPPGFGGGS